MMIRASANRNSDGALTGLICVGKQIIRGSKTHIQQSRSEFYFSEFLDMMPVPIIGVDNSGLISEWNLTAAAITKFPREEVLGKDLVEVYISLDYRASVRQVLSNALQGQVTANFEFQLCTKDNKCVDVLLNATPRTDASGRIVGILGVGQDITERKQVEAEKSRVALELQTFIDTANAPIFGIDAAGLVNEWNNKSAAITGFSREEVLGKDFVLVSFRLLCRSLFG